MGTAIVIFCCLVILACSIMLAVLIAQTILTWNDWKKSTNNKNKKRYTLCGIECSKKLALTFKREVEIVKQEDRSGDYIITLSYRNLYHWSIMA